MKGAYIVTQETGLNIVLSYEAFAQVPEDATFDAYTSLREGIEGVVIDDQYANMLDLLKCDIHIELANFFVADFGMMFNGGVSEPVISTFNKAILKVQDSHSNDYVHAFLDREYSQEFCHRKYRSEQLDLDEMIELWYIFFAFVALSIIAFCIVLIITYYKEGSKKRIEDVDEILSPKNSRNNSGSYEAYEVSNKSGFTLRGTGDMSHTLMALNMQEELKQEEVEEVAQSIPQEEGKNSQNIAHLGPIKINSSSNKINEKIEKDIQEAINVTLLLPLEIRISTALVLHYWKSIYNFPHTDTPQYLPNSVSTI